MKIIEWSNYNLEHVSLTETTSLRKITANYGSKNLYILLSNTKEACGRLFNLVREVQKKITDHYSYLDTEMCLVNDQQNCQTTDTSCPLLHHYPRSASPPTKSRGHGPHSKPGGAKLRKEIRV